MSKLDSLRILVLSSLLCALIQQSVSAHEKKFLTDQDEPNLVLIKGDVSLGEITFKDAVAGRAFIFPIIGSSSLLGWYFQPAANTQKYSSVISLGTEKNSSIEIFPTKHNRRDLKIWASLLDQITQQLEKISVSTQVEKPEQIEKLLILSSRLPNSFKSELQIDLLVSRLFLASDQAARSLSITSAAKSCLNRLSTFSEYCFELLRTRSGALERVGDFQGARDLQVSTVDALSHLTENNSQRSRIIIMRASSEQLNVHVAVSESNLSELQSSVYNIKEILLEEKSQSLLSTYQKGLMNLMIGSALVRSGDFESSVAPLSLAERQFKESGDHTYLTSVYSLLHTSQYVQGRYLPALDMITLALDLVAEDSPFYHYYLLVHGNALAKLGRYQQAKASLTTAKIFYESSQNPYYLAGCHRALAIVERELGNYEVAKNFHKLAIGFFLGSDRKNPSDLYSYLAAKSESLITSLRQGDISESSENAAELESLYSKYFESKQSVTSLPRKSILYSLASYASGTNNQSDLAKYRDKLSRLLNKTPSGSYLLEKAQLEKLNSVEDLQQGDFNAAASHFRSLISYVSKTRDQVEILSFQRGYSNIVQGFAAPLIEKLSLSLRDSWDSDTADILLEVLNQTQGSSLVEASRSVRNRIANGVHHSIDEQGSNSLTKEIEVFTAQSRAESYVLRAKADFSVLREDILEAKSGDLKPKKFVHQLHSIDMLIQGLKKDEIYLNSFDTKKYSFLLYLSKSRSGITSLEKSKGINRWIKDAKLLLVDRYSEPEPVLDQISNAFRLEDILLSGNFRHAITTGDGTFSEIPFSTLRVNDDYLGSQLSNTHIASTSYYFSSEEVFDAEQAFTNDIAVIADPNFDLENLTSLNRGSHDEGFRNWISSLSRLPWTEKESQSIMAAFPDAKIAVRTREQATIQSFRNLASTSNVLHIATHGYFSSRTPELAGIALTKTIEPASEFFSLNQISKLDIASRLVVFSACETALSEESAGDSGWGLAQVALYAGARNAVGTLWKIPDRQTATFFENFYSSLSDGQNDISTSLLIAKRAMIDSQYSHPFYWAGFKVFATKRVDTYPFKF